jgi:predicted aspartyl protease
MKMLVLGLACLATSGHAACVTQRVADIPLTVYQNKLLLTVGINGSPETMALDTGAGITVISAEAAGRLNILHDFDHAAEVGGVGGADSALFIGQVDALSVGNAGFTRLALPIVAFPERDWQNHPLAGLLGADILAHFAVDVDIAGGHLALWRETGCDNEPPPWDDNATPIAIELDESNHIQVPLKVDGVTLNALLDTGAGGFVLTQRAGMRAGVTDDALESDPEIHGTGVNNRPWSGHVHRFHDVRFGQARFTDVMAALMPSRNIAQYDALIGADALVGMTLLSGTRIWISYHTKSLYVFPASTPQPE